MSSSLFYTLGGITATKYLFIDGGLKTDEQQIELVLNSNVFKNNKILKFVIYNFHSVGRRGGLVVERRTPEREVGGSILTHVPVLYP